MPTGKRKTGGASAVDYRAWRAAHGNWQSHWLRPELEDVDRAMAELSTAFGQTEAEMIKPLMARMAYTPQERAAVVADIRRAITVVATAAWRVAQDGGYLTDNLLFDEIARRWSPTYERALIESAATRPNQMRPETLEAALADIRAQGLRLGRLIALARRDVRGRYKPVLMAKGWRVRPLRKPDATSCLALAGNIQPRPEVETSHPDTVVGEFAYEPILSGPRSVAVINALERTQLQLNVRAAREELVAMKKGRVRGCAPAAQEGSEARGRAEGPLREGLHLGAPVDPEHLPRRYQAGAAAPGASAHEIAASQVWPGDPDGPARAKLVTVAGGYGSKPHEIARNTGLTVEEARAVLSAISPGIEIFRAYTRKIAWAVPQYEGFIFTDPFCSTRVLGRARTGSRLKSYKRRPSGSWRRRVSRLVSSWLRQRP